MNVLENYHTCLSFFAKLYIQDLIFIFKNEKKNEIIIRSYVNLSEE